MRFAASLLALSIGLPTTASAAIEIRHEPVPCVPADRFARITAAATPAEQVARAELQFRARPGGDWYSMAMAAHEGVWSAFLPRPHRPLGRFEYRIVMTATDLVAVETPAFPVRVAADAAQCAGAPESSVAVAAPIVIRVPPGAPLVPPVPPGFSPAGVVTPEGPPPRDKWRAAKWIAGAGAAAGIGAAAAGVGTGPPELPPVPDFALSGTTPNPGGDFSLSRDRLTVYVLVSGEPREPLTFQWFFGLRQAGPVEVTCLDMGNTMTIGSERPVLLELTSPLHIVGFCGNTFQIDSGRLSIVVDGQVVREVTQELPFRVVP